MISDETLFKTSVALSIAGIAALFALSVFMEPQKILPENITDKMLGKIVEVSGQVNSITVKDGNVFMTINGLKIVMFSKEAGRNASVYEIERNENVTVEGKVSIYKGDLEIIANRIERN